MKTKKEKPQQPELADAAAAAKKRESVEKAPNKKELLSMDPHWIEYWRARH